MSRNPFVPCDQETEFSFGPGRFPAQDIDFSQGGFKSGFPIADPDVQQQLLDLAASRRTDLNDPGVPDMPGFAGTRGEHPDYYTTGNTERYGANPPLIRSRRWPKFKRWIYTRPNRMEREW